MFRKKSVAGVLALLATNGALALNLVAGGGFELPAIPEGSPYTLDVTPAGWTGTGDLAVQGYAGSVFSGDGDQWFDLNPGTLAGAGISQTFTLAGGVQYALEFVYNGGGGGSTSQVFFAVTAAAQTLLSGSVSTAALDVYNGSPWALYSGSFTPTVDTTATLTFVPNGSYSGGFIDAVSVSAVPEPATSSMMLVAGLALFARIMRSRR